MYRRNDAHRQASMFGNEFQMPRRRWQEIADGWAGAFYRDFFCRIEEGIFAELYSDVPSRPNVPVNVLVGFEVLKAGFGWSDEEAHDAVCFDVQVRYALGYRDIYEDTFTLRTVSNFRRAVERYEATTGRNLFLEVFRQVCGEQATAYEVRSKHIRMDSTQVRSNIADMTRLQLLVTVLHRIWRVLDEQDKAHWQPKLGPYVEKPARNYAYQLRGNQPQARARRIGKLMVLLSEALKEKYGRTEAYGLLRRALAEQFDVIDEVVVLLPPEEVSAQSLQSPDDPQATYRTKAGRSYRGYVANIAETCDDGNQVQLIVDVAVEPNSVDDGQMLVEGIDDLVARTEVETLITDGGYNGPAVDEALTAHGIEQLQTGIRGGAPRSLSRDAFDWELGRKHQPVATTCPHGQRAAVEPSAGGTHLVARFDAGVCAECPLREQCPTDALKRRPQRVLRFTAQQVTAARRMQNQRLVAASGTNPRASIEATIGSLKATLPLGRVPYRGQARVMMYMVAKAAMCNVRRLTAARLRRGRPLPDDGPDRPRSGRTTTGCPAEVLRRAVVQLASFLASPLIRVAVAA